MLNMLLRLRAPLSLAFGLSLIVATGTAAQAHHRPALQVPGPVAIPADYAGRNPAAPTGIPRPGRIAALFRLLGLPVADAAGTPLGTVTDVTIDADSLEPRQVVVDLLGADRKPDRLVAIDVRDIGGDTANGLTAHLARNEAAGLPDFRYGEGVSSLNKSTDLGEEAEDGDE